MYVTRGDLTSDPIAAKRNRGLEPAQSIPARKADQDPALQYSAEVRTPAERQRVRLIQRALSRAQSALAGLEEFRSMLGHSGAESFEPSALELLEGARYQGEAVLEPHRAAEHFRSGGGSGPGPRLLRAPRGRRPHGRHPPERAGPAAAGTG
jgi:hypothetical protein